MSAEKNENEIAVFGGGCFWCTEAIFKSLKGVYSVMPGYAGGNVQDPTYEEVCSGKTGHAEAVQISFDSAMVSFETLLTVFFASHDPTTLNRQGADVGTQYRSVVFYTNELQKEIANKFISDLNNSNKLGNPIVTTIERLDKFYEADNYYRDYFAQHPNQPYCLVVINPKLEKLKKNFANLLKENNI